MIRDIHNDQRIALQNYELEEVSEFQNLGSTTTSSENTKAEIG